MCRVPDCIARNAGARQFSYKGTLSSPKIQEPSVQRVVGPSDKIGLPGTEKQGQGSYFSWLSHSADRLRFVELLQHLFLIPRVVFLQEPINKRGVDAGGRNAITANVIRQIIAGHGESHRTHSAFAHGISETVRQP